MPGRTSPEKLATVDTPIVPGQWHKVVEVRGIHMTAQVDGQQTIAGESSCVDVHKAAQGEGSNGRDFPDRISGRQSEC